jgi:hypothetical protein
MRSRLWRYAAWLAALLAAAPLAAQNAVPVPPALPPQATVPPLTPAQEAAALLGRWETCIDLAAQFMAYSALGSKRSVANVERKCATFEAQVRPVLARSLREMMYGSSDEEVARQTEVAVGALRRHIHARAVAAVARIRAR